MSSNEVQGDFGVFANSDTGSEQPLSNYNLFVQAPASRPSAASPPATPPNTFSGLSLNEVHDSEARQARRSETGHSPAAATAPQITTFQGFAPVTNPLGRDRRTPAQEYRAGTPPATNHNNRTVAARDIGTRWRDWAYWERAFQGLVPPVVVVGTFGFLIWGLVEALRPRPK